MIHSKNAGRIADLRQLTTLPTVANKSVGGKASCGEGVKEPELVMNRVAGPPPSDSLFAPGGGEQLGFNFRGIDGWIKHPVLSLVDESHRQQLLTKAKVVSSGVENVEVGKFNSHLTLRLRARGMNLGTRVFKGESRVEYEISIQPIPEVGTQAPSVNRGRIGALFIGKGQEIRAGPDREGTVTVIDLARGNTKAIENLEFSGGRGGSSLEARDFAGDLLELTLQLSLLCLNSFQFLLKFRG